MTPLQKAAHDIGAKGSEPTEEERLAFEAWMRGHCWKVVGDWDGKQYVHAHESIGFVHGGAMNTRGLWAAWRDRGAVARVLAEQAQAVEPVAIYDIGVNEKLGAVHLLKQLKSGDKLYLHPAPPPAMSFEDLIGTTQHRPAGEHVPETAFGNTERAELIARLRSTAFQDDEVKAHAREAADMLEAAAQEIARLHADSAFDRSEYKRLRDELRTQLARRTVERDMAIRMAAGIEAQQVAVLTDLEQYRMQIAGISTAALGYWSEGDEIHPDYDTPALRDVARLYVKYDQLFKEKEARRAQQVAVPLTEDELIDLWLTPVGDLGAFTGFMIVARAIEAHHNIKAKPDHTDWSAA